MSNSSNTRNAYATIAALALAAGLGAAYAGSDTDEDARRSGQTTTTASSPELALEEILAQLRAAGYSDIREIERERGQYEIEGRNPEGDRVELYVDARTGEVVKEERED